MPDIKTSRAELIRLAAERVMEWRTYDKEGYLWWADENGPRVEGSWNPLTSDTDCWMLVDKLAVDNREFTLERSYMCEFRSYAWYANFDDAATARDPDRRRAIVTACVRAVGAIAE